MKRLALAAAAACCLLAASPAPAATIITFEDGDVTGGGVFIVPPLSTIVDDLAIVGPPASGKALYTPPSDASGIPDLAAIFLSGHPAASTGLFLVVQSFDIRAVKTATLRVVADQMSGTALYEFALTAGEWAHIVAPFAQTTSSGDIRVDGGFHLDNVSWDFSSSDPNPPFNYPPRTGVPEPAGWALMLAGFGLAGAGLRGRRALAA